MNTSGGISSRSPAIRTILSTLPAFLPLTSVTNRERREAGGTITAGEEGGRNSLDGWGLFCVHSVADTNVSGIESKQENWTRSQIRVSVHLFMK
jgi:hypothetical protein